MLSYLLYDYSDIVRCFAGSLPFFLLLLYGTHTKLTRGTPVIARALICKIRLRDIFATLPHVDLIMLQ